LHGPTKTSLLNWVNILSLDAPVVAVLWQGFFAQLFHVHITLAARFVLGFSVWLAYVADRWMDGWMLPPGAAVTLRHQFAQRYARAIAIAWALVFVGNFMLALIGLSSREFMFGLGLAVVVLGYLAFVHFRSLHHLVGRTKELLVAVVFSAGSTVFVLANFSGNARPLLWCALVFGFLCLINCLLVSGWERAEDARQAQPSMAIRWNVTPTVSRQIALGAMVGVAAVSALWWKRPLGWTSLAAGISFLFLATLERFPRNVSIEERRVLADATLLSPLVIVLLFSHEL